MTHLTLTIAHYLQSPVSEFLTLISEVFKKFQERRIIRATEKALYALSDRELNDIGISRGDIYSLVRGDRSLKKSIQMEANSNLKGWV